jgi:FkbM family methyltransferase
MATDTFGTMAVKCRPNTTDWNTLSACITHDEYLLDRLLVKGGIMVDMGAHAGGATLKALSLGAKVYAIEMCPENVSALIENCRLNGLVATFSDEPGSRVVVIPKMLYTHNTHVEVDVSKEDTLFEYHHRYIWAPKLHVEPSPGTVQIETVDLNTVLQDVPHVDVLKIDAEGGEWWALMTARADILDKIDIIVGEFNPAYRIGGGHETWPACPRTPDQCQTPADLMDILGELFEDVTHDYFGYRMCEKEPGLFGYVLRNKRLRAGT